MIGRILVVVSITVIVDLNNSSSASSAVAVVIVVFTRLIRRPLHYAAAWGRVVTTTALIEVGILRINIVDDFCAASIGSLPELILSASCTWVEGSPIISCAVVWCVVIARALTSITAVGIEIAVATGILLPTVAAICVEIVSAHWSALVAAVSIDIIATVGQAAIWSILLAAGTLVEICVICIDIVDDDPRF